MGRYGEIWGDDIKELRNICSLAQVRGAAGPGAALQLLTFDGDQRLSPRVRDTSATRPRHVRWMCHRTGDQTLYPDRATLGSDAPLVPLLLELLTRGVALALVTAVGFDEAAPYEARLWPLRRPMNWRIVSHLDSPIMSS